MLHFNNGKTTISVGKLIPQQCQQSQKCSTDPSAKPPLPAKQSGSEKFFQLNLHEKKEFLGLNSPSQTKPISEPEKLFKKSAK